MDRASKRGLNRCGHINRGVGMKSSRWASFIVGAFFALASHAALAAGAADIARDANASLQKLYAAVPAAKTLGAKAHAILVFPTVTKAGLGIGGQFGEGALLKGGKAVAFYNTTGVSTGLQAGAQQFGYALFFMNEKALAQLDKTEGFEVGVGPSVVVMDEGKAKSTTTTSMKDDIYAFIFGQKGLMAGLGVQGNKITKINPK
jgi:lipid-binding SYLF domain-containing protein